jgi:hypothetical protein
VLCRPEKGKGEERVGGVGGRGKYPGAPPHHIRKKREKQADRKRYLIGQVVKGERLKKKKSYVVT